MACSGRLRMQISRIASYQVASAMLKSAARRLNVVLVHPDIPGNTGTIARSCMAVGAALHLIHPLGYSLDEKALRRVTLNRLDSTRA